MGKTKTDLFTPQQNYLANLAKAIAHPARIAILEYLAKTGSCVCGDIVEELPLSQSTVSQHLKAMKEAGVIKDDADGTYRCYCLDMEQCKILLSRVTSLFTNGKCC